MLWGSARRWAQPGGPRDTKSPHDSLGGRAAHQDAARVETWGPLYGLGVHWYNPLAMVLLKPKPFWPLCSEAQGAGTIQPWKEDLSQYPGSCRTVRSFRKTASPPGQTQLQTGAPCLITRPRSQQPQTPPSRRSHWPTGLRTPPGRAEGGWRRVLSRTRPPPSAWSSSLLSDRQGGQDPVNVTRSGHCAE